ncbi:hypothetical protein GCM10010326_77350 [Streptomyces xanthochromogenes]|uniref:Uncharacterized protein n=1 Tax=Streptomyces xanthochromogenes TaxID=67384 RepID=A0ABQ3B228_9ACTN|nr:hypothetical protein GCM10010326_77350 [Streptomyces xanthochromogenes]
MSVFQADCETSQLTGLGSRTLRFLAEQLAARRAEIGRDGGPSHRTSGRAYSRPPVGMSKTGRAPSLA